jgi:uncharacterized protein (DUF952 family)
MPIIYHIACRTAWNAACASESYTTGSLASEGYIHCSTARQVIATANRLFKGRRDIVLLCIDTERLKAEIRYENLEGGTDLFPHVYGALEIAAISAMHDFPPRKDGNFELPLALSAGMSG